MSSINEQASAIKLFIFDIDGVMTDGKLWIGANGEVFKTFHAQDGMGLRKLQQQGIKIAVISGRESDALKYRLKELNINDAYLKVENKEQALAQLQEKTSIPLQNIAYMGDDTPDYAVMQKVGLSFAPANASTEVKNIADMITAKSGGDGAVREAIEQLLAWRQTTSTAQQVEQHA